MSGCEQSDFTCIGRKWVYIIQDCSHEKNETTLINSEPHDLTETVTDKQRGKYR